MRRNLSLIMLLIPELNTYCDYFKLMLAKKYHTVKVNVSPAGSESISKDTSTQGGRHWGGMSEK